MLELRNSKLHVVLLELACSYILRHAVSVSRKVVLL
jgi:hypothetical protein